MKRLHLLWELSMRGTIARVAEALNYTPSAVSQQLSLLEREAGVPLMRRVGRTLELTPAGQRLVVETEQLLAGLERAEAGLRRDRDETSGTVRVAVFQSAMLALFPSVLRDLADRHPGVRVEMVQYEPGEALWETRARGFDLVVAEHYPGHAAPHLPGLDRLPLMTDALWLCVPGAEAPGGARAAAIRRLDDAARWPWVMEPRGAASRHFAEERCREAGFEPDVRYETADLQAHVRLIESGNAVALLPGLMHGTIDGELSGLNELNDQNDPNGPNDPNDPNDLNGPNDLNDPHPSPARALLRRIPLAEAPRRTIFTAARASGSSDPALAAVRAALHDEASRRALA